MKPPKAHMDRIGHDVTPERAHRSCLDKVRYDSRNEARDRATKLRKKYPDSPRQRVYRCTLCCGFHLTSVRESGKHPAAPVRFQKTA